MRVTRIYTGADGQSHFEDLELPLELTTIGRVSSPVATQSVFFRDTGEGGPAVASSRRARW